MAEVDVEDELTKQGYSPDEARHGAIALVVILEEYRLLHAQGWGLAPLLAIDCAASAGLPSPDWAACSLSESLHRWQSAQSRSFGEAFGIDRPANWNQAAAQVEAENLPHVRDAVIALRASGAKFDEALWEEVEQRTGVGAATARRWWYRNQRPKGSEQDF